MIRRSKAQAKKLGEMESEFLALLIRCLGDCAQGRWGLFGQNDPLPGTGARKWSEADRLKELAREIQAVRNQAGDSNEVCARFLDLCALRGPQVPGEPKLAAAFLAEINRT